MKLLARRVLAVSLLAGLVADWLWIFNLPPGHYGIGVHSQTAGAALYIVPAITLVMLLWPRRDSD